MGGQGRPVRAGGVEAVMSQEQAGPGAGEPGGPAGKAVEGVVGFLLVQREAEQGRQGVKVCLADSYPGCRVGTGPKGARMTSERPGRGAAWTGVGVQGVEEDTSGRGVLGAWLAELGLGVEGNKFRVISRCSVGAPGEVAVLFSLGETSRETGTGRGAGRWEFCLDQFALFLSLTESSSRRFDFFKKSVFQREGQK